MKCRYEVKNFSPKGVTLSNPLYLALWNKSMLRHKGAKCPLLNILEGAPMCFGSLSPSLKNSLFNDYWTREVVKRTKTVSFFVRPSFQLRSCVLHLTLLALFPIVLELRKLSNSSYNFNLSKSLIDKIRIHSALKKFTHLKFNFRVILMLLLAVTKDCSTI